MNIIKLFPERLCTEHSGGEFHRVCADARRANDQQGNRRAIQRRSKKCNASEDSNERTSAKSRPRPRAITHKADAKRGEKQQAESRHDATKTKRDSAYTMSREEKLRFDVRNNTGGCLHGRREETQRQARRVSYREQPAHAPAHISSCARSHPRFNPARDPWRRTSSEPTFQHPSYRFHESVLDTAIRPCLRIDALLRTRDIRSE